MALQETGKIEFVLGPEARRARIIDLKDKEECWERHIEIAEKVELWQVKIGKNRLRELRWQIGENPRRLK